MYLVDTNSIIHERNSSHQSYRNMTTSHLYRFLGSNIFVVVFFWTLSWSIVRRFMGTLVRYRNTKISSLYLLETP